MNYLFEAFKLLNEDIEAVKKYYPNIEDDTFMKIISSDPTFKKDSNSVGTYGKWLLNLFNKNKIKENDLEKAKEYLTLFDDNKKWIENKDIGHYKSLDELEDVLSNIEVGEESHARKLKDVRKKIKKSNIDEDAEVVYEDNKWIIYIPKTYEASCKLGYNSKWCTATKETRDYYDDYTSEGPLYIIINKNDENEKYQFHVESGSYMDINDDSIVDFEDVFNDEEDEQVYLYLKSNNILPKTLNEALIEYFKKENSNDLVEVLIDGYDFQNQHYNDERISLKDVLKFYDSPSDLFPLEYFSDSVTEDNIPYKSMTKENEELLARLRDWNEDVDEDDITEAFLSATEQGLFQGSYDDYISDLNRALKDVVESLNSDYEDINLNIELTDDSKLKLTTTIKGINKLVMSQADEYDLNDYSQEEVNEEVINSLNEILANAIDEQFKLYEPRYGWQGFSIDTFNEELNDRLYELF